MFNISRADWIATGGVYLSCEEYWSMLKHVFITNK